VEVRINDGPWIKAIGTTSWNLSWDSTIVDDGGQTIHARSFDETDFSTEASVTVTVDNLPPQEPQDNWIWIVVGVVIVVVIILLALYLLIRRKKKEMELDESPEVESGN
jgi:LPXTG-motif cell wall-anchored protein